MKNKRTKESDCITVYWDGRDRDLYPKDVRRLLNAESDLILLQSGKYVSNLGVNGYDNSFIIQLEYLLNAIFATYVQHTQGKNEITTKKFWHKWNAKSKLQQVEFLTVEAEKHKLSGFISNKAEGGKISKRKKESTFISFKDAVKDNKIDPKKSYEANKIKLKNLGINIKKSAYYDYKGELK